MGSNFEKDSGLKRTLKNRHMSMIALGGVIGTGLFLNSGSVIHQAGAGGAIIAYAFGGIVMFLTMLCLGELALRHPEAGSAQTYATTYLGKSHGFVVGWIYWLNWAVTLGLELITVAILMQYWFPESPAWLWSFIFTILLLAVNLLSARGFGEVEYWFSLIKVIAIVVFIIVGVGALTGLIHSTNSESFSRLANLKDTPLFPNGIGAVLVTLIGVNFAFQGTELLGVTAGESENPHEAIPRAIRSTAFRIIFFFIISIFIVAAIIPWKDAGMDKSPFVYVFELVGIPYADHVMNFVIVTAVLSVANSGLYATSRMMYSMSKKGMAPTFLKKVNKRGVPVNAILFSMVFGLFSLLSGIYAEETVYNWLLYIGGFGAVVVWFVIALSNLVGRKQYLNKGGKLEDLTYRTPWYPVVPLLAVLFNGMIIVSLAFIPDQRLAIYCGVPFIILCYVYYYVVVEKRIHIETISVVNDEI